MDLSSVTMIGVLAFVCFKFAGYLLAFRFLKKIYPTIEASVLLMAGARTVLGVIAGGALYLGWDALRHRFAGFYNFSYEPFPYYVVVVLLRVFVWGAIILLFRGIANMSLGRVSLYAFGGALLSSLLDIPAALFAFLIPGGFLFC